MPCEGDSHDDASRCVTAGASEVRRTVAADVVVTRYAGNHRASRLAAHKRAAKLCSEGERVVTDVFGGHIVRC